MKAKKILFLIFFFCLLITGCEKDEPVDPPDPIKPPPTYDAWADDYAISLGDSAMVTWVSEHVDSVHMDFLSVDKEKTTISFGPNGSEYFALSDTTEFMFTFYAINGTTPRKGFTVDVTEPSPPIPGSLYIETSSQLVAYGYTVAITVALIEGVIDSITVSPDLPGFIGTVGIFITPPLTETVTYIFTAYYNGVAEPGVAVTITVLPPTRTDTLCSAPLWAPDSIWGRLSDADTVPWEYMSPSQATIYTQALAFYSNGTVSQYRLPEYELLGTAPFYFVGGDENYIYWPYEVKHIMELNLDVFITEFELVLGYDTLFLRVKSIPINFP